MSDEKTPDPPPEEGAPEEKPPAASWEFRTEFAMHAKLKDVIRRTMDVTASEVDVLKRKLDKLTYGS